jgi:molybdopterin-guanine dinucleotide biosynthesis protein
MNPIIFCGYHHTGKTTLLERAIGPLARRGRRVGVVKHASGRLDFEASGKDLSRYMSAGAVEVHLLSLIPGGSRGPGGILSPGGRNGPGGSVAERGDSSLELILAVTSADFLLIEGFKDYRGPIPRIVFGRNREEIERFMDGGTVGYSGFGLGELRFDEERPEEGQLKDRRRFEPPPRGARFLPMDIDPEALADFLAGISRR